MESDLSKSCYQKALQLLARRDHSCTELRTKLKSRSYGHPEIEAAISECLRLDYLNDTRFAEGYSKQLLRKGYGINGIKHKLYVKGVSKEVIQESVTPYDSDNAQLEQCRRVLKKKLKPLTGKASAKNQGAKLHRFLFRRGFSSHIIRQTIGEMTTRQD